MSETRSLETLTAEAVEHLRLIRKYTAWIAFFVVLAGAFGLLSILLFVLNTVGTTEVMVPV
jgi:hypothetical protein